MSGCAIEHDRPSIRKIGCFLGYAELGSVDVSDDLLGEFVDECAEISKQFFDAMGIFGSDEVQLLALLSLYHFPLEHVVVLEFSVGRMVRVDKDRLVVEIILISILSML